MKKLMALICVLSASLSLFSFACCGEEKKTEVKGDTETVIADFESWAPSFQLMRLINGFGKVTENNDAAYVKSGSSSAKLPHLSQKI